ncbi:MAG: DUF427 domain-containing protein [Woeseia sp.]
MWNHTGKKRPDFAVEPGEGQESVWDYPRPPSLVPDERAVEVIAPEGLVARTSRAYRLCETASPPTFYLPPDDVNFELLTAAQGSSHCEWKGQASYWALASTPDTVVGWCYPNPSSRYEALREYVAFYPALLECYVAGERVKPQPGRFYGGWITKDVVGPFKGEPGTGHW